MKKIFALLIFLLSSFSFANAGIPMLALAWPYLWLTFIPVSLLEACIAKRMLRIDWRKAIEISVKANCISTLIGIPVAWFFMLLIQMVVGLGLSNFQNVPDLIQYATFPFMVAWLGDVSSAWYVYFAFCVLSIFFCLISIYIERGVAKRYIEPVFSNSVNEWAKLANITSYSIIVITTTIWPVLSK